MTRKRKGSDPFDRECPACGADKGKPCTAIGKDHRLISRATRLVHADRIEETNP